MGRAPDGERRLIALPGGRRVNVKMSNIKPAGDLDTEIVQRDDTSAVPWRGLEDPPCRAVIEAHNLTHLPAAEVALGSLLGSWSGLRAMEGGSRMIVE